MSAAAKPLRLTALAAILALAAVLDTHRLAQNGYANIFYSAGVKSMLGSLHNFVFVSFDPGGLITIDKPPFGLWVQVLSAKLFGFSPLSLLLPEAIAGVLAVAALYWATTRTFGPPAALASALALAAFPSFVAVSRDNNLDAVLILLMVLACGAALRAIESGRWRWLLGSALLIGIAFNTKTLAAYLVVPGIALAYAVCAPGTLSRRLTQLALAGLLTAAVSASWIAFVELTPAAQRPYVGGSTDNSELGLTFSYNGFGRVDGQVGGPGQIPVGTGAVAPSGTHERKPRERHSARSRPTSALPRPTSAPPRPASGSPRPKRPPPLPTSGSPPTGRALHPVAFGGPTGPFRLLGLNLGDQGGWLLPLAFIGSLTLALLTIVQRRERRDPRLAGLLVLGGWFVVEGCVLSLSKGIVHPYYVSALGPGLAAMAGAGSAALGERTRRLDWRMALLTLAVAATVVVQILLLRRVHYMHWLAPLLIAGATLGLVGCVALGPRRAPAVALTFALLLIAPTAYAATTWQVPVQGTFPAAGPRQTAGYGGLGVSPTSVARNKSLLRYVSTHRPATRWAVLADASNSASPLILLGLHAGALGGFSGTDPALDGPSLARLVARGEARYVVLGGAYSSRGGNRATSAVLRACAEIPSRAWRARRYSRFNLVLYDCAGRERQLRSRRD
ncbi:MAG TPA: glycosyltransferase family 39 protein [Solirubrobacteraceae bacterium]|nr:glycosyltransferase family 39 protein [Solirubrobacteraceae bacterium]